MAGTLSPVNGPSILTLEVERVDTYLTESQADIKAEYVLYNSSDAPVTEDVGIPSLSVSSSPMTIGAIEGYAADQPLVFSTHTEIRLDRFDYSPYLPLIQTFDLKRQWHVASLTVPARTRVTVTLLYTVPYLFKEEDLKGRNEISPMLFRYLRSYAVRWAGRIDRAALYFRPQIKHRDKVRWTPRPFRSEKEMQIYEFDRIKPGVPSDIQIVYDPIEFSVTPYGFRAAAPPLSLPASGNRTFDYANLFDGNPKTTWCEGERGSGVGKGFEIEWGKERWVDEVQIFAGDGSDKNAYESRNRVRTMNVYLAKPGWTSKPIQIELKDTKSYQIFEVPKSSKATILILQILAVYPGEERDDTCIGDVRPILRE